MSGCRASVTVITRAASSTARELSGSARNGNSTFDACVATNADMLRLWRHRRRRRQFAVALRLVAQRRAREFYRAVAVDRRANVVFTKYADAVHGASGYLNTKARQTRAAGGARWRRSAGRIVHD